MECNLQKIKETNLHAITHGKVQRAINQAEDYLSYTLGFDNKKIQLELSEFIHSIKTTRRESRGQKRKDKS